MNADLPSRRNRNRGFQQLRVWQDAIDLYARICRALLGWPFERKKVAGQEIAGIDSVHRNIAELIESLERKRDSGDWQKSLSGSDH